MEPGVDRELKEKVSDVIRSRTQEHWMHAFEGVDACVDPVLSTMEAASSGHATARGLIVEVPGPDGVPIRQIAPPIKFSGYRPEYRRSGPALGQDTREVLSALGLSEAEMADLLSKGIIFGV
jgi:crotonobetainyl-CoA:carnitine CoA-transferase CaiB-like acyl-CoA transferase